MKQYHFPSAVQGAILPNHTSSSLLYLSFNIKLCVGVASLSDETDFTLETQGNETAKSVSLSRPFPFILTKHRPLVQTIFEQEDNQNTCI